MLGNQRIRRASATIGAGALLLTLGVVGPSPADAEVVTIDGEAYGIEGLLLVPGELQGDPEQEVVIEPTPAVVLPDTGTDETPETADESLFEIAPFLDIFFMSVGTQGNLTSANQAGGVISDTLLDDFVFLPGGDFPDGFIRADEIESTCLLDEGREIAGVDFNGLFVGDTEIEQTPDPNTELVVPDFGTIRFNVQERSGNRIEVAAMEMEFDVDFEDNDILAGSLRIGVAECGTELANVVDDAPVVPIAELADAFEGDPEFTG